MNKARILVYCSPAMGHLQPAMGLALELQNRGYQVLVKAQSDQIDKLRTKALEADPIAPAIEAITMDDHLAGNPLSAVKRAIACFSRRATHEIPDIQSAIDEYKPDVLVVDTNCFGARTAAEASGLPWAIFQPFLSPLPAAGVPAFGPGFRPRTDLFGRIRDHLAAKLITNTLGKLTLEAVNPVRVQLGLSRLKSYEDFHLSPPRTLYFTSQAFDYPRQDWPASFVFCGPVNPAKKTRPTPWLENETRPIILVTCSTEAQADRAIIETSLKAFENGPHVIVASTAAHDPKSFRPPSNARVERFVDHDAILSHCAAVICHGGMGITQKALQAGVPVLVVPYGRDQLEVGRRIEYRKLGTCLIPKQLDSTHLRKAFEQTLQMQPSAQRMAQSFAGAGGAVTAADAVAQLIPTI